MSKRCQAENGRGRSVVQWQEKANSVNLEQWKISFEKSLESTRKLNNVMEERYYGHNLSVFLEV